MIEKKENTVKFDFKIADEHLNLKTLENNVIIKKLEDNIKLRSMKIEKHIEKEFLK
ncbi:hypothetical protein KY304_02565 [Candidatus Woesearchaeota archaeon]|nr:hypothetical protein [Candidatus Woesearchaeota archaeon]MBW2978970.1 hypothetical protein [Candidatus Woesearchaeota archaeon]